MNPAALVALSATEILARFEQRSLTPTEYVSACLSRISAINPKINALTAIDAESAISEAANATRRWQIGRPKGALDGLPIGVKDLQDTRGLLTTYGSVRARGHVPRQDIPMVAKLRTAGAIILAKTNVPELGAGGNSRNPVWGATGNPFNPNLTAGGSSGGSAAALSAELLPLCTGSDTGGSLRTPAALCGIVGYRPSVGVIAHPTRPLGWSGISVLGPMARTMDDLCLMLGVCQGDDPDDPLSVAGAVPNPAALPPADLKSLRVGFSEDFGDLPVDPAIRQTFRTRIRLLENHVGSCHRAELDLGELDRTFDILRGESFVAAFADAMEATPDAFGEHIRENVELGLSMSLADRAWAHGEQTRILRKFNALMRDYDVILMPTSPVSPFPWMQSHPAEINGQAMDIYYRWLALSYRSSLIGGPVITIPTGRDPYGMPFGLQMLGPTRGDESLLSAAKALQALFASDSETARPVPDVARIAPSTMDLRSIVTHPPILKSSTQAEPLSMKTAV
ncbi:amidase [Minwuia sp.]|uniref:amidase n=1 Tax=Minwuia sp. TaxID=2493630 RepID=UPI003A937610